VEINVLDEKVMGLFFSWVVDEVVLGDENREGRFDSYQDVLLVLETIPCLSQGIHSLPFQNHSFFFNVSVITANIDLGPCNGMRTDGIIFDFCEVDVGEASSCDFVESLIIDLLG
jgi:hypothetical protein